MLSLQVRHHAFHSLRETEFHAHIGSCRDVTLQTKHSGLHQVAGLATKMTARLAEMLSVRLASLMPHPEISFKPYAFHLPSHGSSQFLGAGKNCRK